jgi:hypothetical protein
MNVVSKLATVSTVGVFVLAALGVSSADASASTWGHCPSSNFSYPCTVTTALLNARNQPGPQGIVLYQYQQGDWVAIDCWTTGSNVNGDTVWYWSHPNGGPLPWAWVTGYLLDTGSDPRPGVRHC